MTGVRETYWRVFSSELNTATYEIKTEEEMKPTYQLSRLGALITRVLITGVLTEKENAGSEDEPMWRGRIQDVAGGTVYINIGRFQPEAAATMNTLEIPCRVSVIGKVKSYTNDEGKTFVSVRPERIVQVNTEIQQQWLLDTAKTTWQRLVAMKRAINGGDCTAEGLVAQGFPAAQAENIAMALDVYGQPDSISTLKSIQAALRSLLPDLDINFVEDEHSEQPEDFGIDEGGQGPAEGGEPAVQQGGAPVEDQENLVLSLIRELNDGKGAPRDLLESRCMDEGISSMELEEILETLLDKGLAYEPNLKYIKLVDD